MNTRGRAEVQLHYSLPRHWMEMNCELHASLFTLEEEDLVTHWIGGWVGSRAGLNAVETRKISFVLARIELRSPSPEVHLHT
jgi:hypothetical protein